MVNGGKGLTIEDGVAHVQRESDAGRETYELPLPAVVGVKEGINLPRYPTMKGRLASKKAEVDVDRTRQATRAASTRCRCAAGRDSGRRRHPRHRPGGGCRPSSTCSSRSGCCDGGLGTRRRRARPRRARTGDARGADRRRARSATEIDALTIGDAADALAEQLAPYGVATVHQAHDPLLTDYGPEAWGEVVAQAVRALAPAAVLATGTDRGNEVLAQAAARLDLPFVANCTEFGGGEPLTLTRVRWGGSLLEDATLTADVKLAHDRPSRRRRRDRRRRAGRGHAGGARP